MQLLTHDSIQYWYSPANGIAKELRPLVLFLHGSGDRGENPNDVLNWGLPKFVANSEEPLNFHLVAPQCPSELRWSDILSTVSEIVICTRLVYLSPSAPIIAAGFSMGAQGALEICASNKSLFQCVVAVAGRCTPLLEQMGFANIAETKAVLIHGEMDPVASSDASRKIADHIRKNQGCPILKILPERDHYIADDVFSLSKFQSLIFDEILP